MVFPPLWGEGAAFSLGGYLWGIGFSLESGEKGSAH